MMHARHLVPALLGVAFVLAPPPAGAADTEVAVSNFKYSPRYVRVDPGDTVTWRVRDGSTHTVTTRAGAPVSFDSGDRSPGETYAFAFARPGRYEYFCRIHPTLGQEGVVQVGPDTTPPRLTRPAARRGRRSVRLSFRLSEEARVRVVVRRAGRTVGTIRTKLLRDGARSVVFGPRRLAPGRYRAALVAIDRAGNASKAAFASFAVPR